MKKHESRKTKHIGEKAAQLPQENREEFLRIELGKISPTLEFEICQGLPSFTPPGCVVAKSEGGTQIAIWDKKSGVRARLLSDASGPQMTWSTEIRVEGKIGRHWYKEREIKKGGVRGPWGPLKITTDSGIILEDGAKKDMLLQASKKLGVSPSALVIISKAYFEGDIERLPAPPPPENPLLQKIGEFMLAEHGYTSFVPATGAAEIGIDRIALFAKTLPILKEEPQWFKVWFALNEELESHREGSQWSWHGLVYRHNIRNTVGIWARWLIIEMKEKLFRYCLPEGKSVLVAQDSLKSDKIVSRRTARKKQVIAIHGSFACA